MTNIAVACGSTQLSNTAITLPSSSGGMYGIDGTLSFAIPRGGAGHWHSLGARRSYSLGRASTRSTTFPQGDTPALNSVTTLSTIGLPSNSTNSSTNFQEVATYTYDAHPELLDPTRTTQTDYKRTSYGTQSIAPSKQTSYYAATFLPSASYAYDTGTGSYFGQQFTQYDAGGHLTQAVGYAAGSLFSTTSNVTTQVWAVDLNTGLRTGLTVTYTDPNSGWTDTYGESYPLASYDTANRPQSTTDGLGVKTTYTYDALGRVTQLAKGGQATINTTYPHEWQTVSTQNGFSTTTSLDGFGHVMTRVRGTDGVTETYSIDTNGQPVKLVETPTTGAARTTQKVFDARGRVTSVTPPVGPTVSYTYAIATGAYAGAQSVTASYSGQTFTTNVIQDQWGQALSSTDPFNTVTTKTFDAMGHVTSVTVTPSGQAAQPRTFTYNGLGFLTQQVVPETGTQKFQNFESHGLPTTLIEGGGRTRTVAYDGMGRVRSVSGANGDSQTFNYNGLQQAIFQTTSSGQNTKVVYGYTDGYGRINQETVTPPAGASWVQKYAYDGAGRLSTLTYPDNNVVGYTYDDVDNYGRVIGVTLNGSTLAIVGDGVNPGTEYDGWGNLETLTFGSGAKNAWTYSSNGLQIQSQVITPVSGSATTRTYGYDALNHLNQAGEWTSLTHDALGRLTQATGMGLSVALGHDGYTNNTNSQASGTVPPAFNNFTFNPFASDQIPSTATNGAITDWVYDGNGEATYMGSAIGSSAPQASFGWDGLGRLSSTTLSGATETYAYLPSGLRVQLLDSANPSNNLQFAYTSGGKLLTEWTGSGSSWSWKGDVIYLGSMAIAEYTNTGIHELHSDHLGTPRVITYRNSGAVEGVQAFGPYGEAMGSTYTNGYAPMTGYTGHAQTDPMDLIYMGGRFYSPAWHRFINSDQGADAFSPNQFAYCGGSPMMRTDPTGLLMVGPLDIIMNGDTMKGGWSSSGLESGQPSTDNPWNGSTSSGDNSESPDSGDDSGDDSQVDMSKNDNPTVDYNTVLPDGQVLGDVVLKYREALRDAMTEALQNPLCDDPVGESLATMLSIAMPGGPIDFKNNFKGQGDAVTLGLAGNYAYYAIGSAIIPTKILDAGAGSYALYSAIRGQKDFSSLTGPLFSDASAYSVRNAALAWGAKQ